MDEATDAEKIHLFAVNAKLIIYEIETMLAGIKLVMKRSLGKFLINYELKYLCFSDATSSKGVRRLSSLLRAYVRRRSDRDYPYSLAEGRTWLRLGFITLCQLVNCLQTEESSISSALYHQVSELVDEIVGAVAAEIMSHAHAEGMYYVFFIYLTYRYFSTPTGVP